MISTEKLEKYGDFIDPEHSGVIYDPRLGLSRALSVLTPDVKGLVLDAMGTETYFGSGRLNTQVLDWMKGLGFDRTFPITEIPIWSYCQLQGNGVIRDGSLVRIGAVVKETNLPTATGYQTGYTRSESSAELVVPLVQCAVDFVYRARTSHIPHRYDSMVRILGGLQSKNDQLKPLAVYDIIDFLVKNPGFQRAIVIATEQHLAPDRVSDILDNLELCGIIDRDSPSIDIDGRRGRGWCSYVVNNRPVLEEANPRILYSQMQALKPYFTDLRRLNLVLNYLKAHPSETYAANQPSETLLADRRKVSLILSLLAELDILQVEDEKFKGEGKKAFARGNELTNLFYEMVLVPAREVTKTLSALPIRGWNKQHLGTFIENFEEERNRRGKKQGENVRVRLLDQLPDSGEPKKLSQIYRDYNEAYPDAMGREGIEGQLKRLIDEGKLEQPERGFYRKVPIINSGAEVC